jgi:hypothetical protein
MIELKYADFRFDEFAENVRNSAPTSMYSDEWMNKMLEITTKANEFSMSDKINFSDRRLMLIAYRIMLKVSLKKARLIEWGIVRGYFDYFYNDDKKIKNDVKTFLTAYIENNFGKGELTEKQIEEMNNLRDIIPSYNIEFPDFVQNAFAKEVVVEYDDEVLRKWKELREYCEMVIDDKRAGKKEKSKCERLLISCQLFV